MLYIIPQWPATETIFKEAFISARVTAFKKWPGPTARQSFVGKGCEHGCTFTKAWMIDGMRIALGWLGCWYKGAIKILQKLELRNQMEFTPNRCSHSNAQKLIRF